MNYQPKVNVLNKFEVGLIHKIGEEEQNKFQNTQRLLGIYDRRLTTTTFHVC